jgi:phosphatidylglycerol:prolipoprotein diacylglycerol transferase
MRQTLFYIPYEIAGVPLFGWGVLLGLWVLFSLFWLYRLSRQPNGSAEVFGQLPMLLMIGAALVILPNFFPGEGLPIRGYGVMLLAAVVCGVGLSLYRAQQMGINPDLIFSLAFWMFIAGILGARAFHVIQKWNTDYARDSWMETFKAVVNIPQGGLVVYGSLIGAGAAFVYFTLKHKLPMLAIADMIAPSLVLGLAIGRIGCLLNGCCFGGPCELPWAVTFPAGSPPFARQMEQGEIQLYGLGFSRDLHSPPVIESVVPNSPAARAGLKPGDQIQAIELVSKGYPTRETLDAMYQLLDVYRRGLPVIIVTTEGRHLALPAPPTIARSAPVHPTQIYSTIGAGLLCLFLVAYYPFRRHDGEIVALELTLYSILRILEEAIRTDEAGMFGTPLSISQIVSLGVLAGVSVLWVYLWRKPYGSALPVHA